MSKGFSAKLTFLGLVALAFCLRSIYFNQTVDFLQPGTGSDASFYLQWAKDIVRGNLLGSDVFYALPLYPYFLSLIYLLSGGETFSLTVFHLLIGSFNCGLIYILVKSLFNNSLGVIAAFLACGYSLFIFYDRMLLPASLAVLLGLLLGLFLLFTRQRPSSPKWFAAGLILGLCTLGAASFSLLAVLILLWIILEYKREPLKRLLLYCLSFVASFLLIIGAVALRNYLVSGDSVLITAHSGINFYIGNNSRANGLFEPPPLMRPTQSGLIEDAGIVAEQMRSKRLKPSQVSNFWFRRSLDFIKAQPLAYLKLLGKKLLLFCRGAEYIDEIEYYIYKEKARLFAFPLINFSFILPLATLGMVFYWRQRRRLILLYGFVLGPALAVILFFVNSRYRLIVVPYLIIFAAAACWQTVAMYRNRQYSRLVYTLILFSLLYFLVNVQTGATGSKADYIFHYNKAVLLCDRQQFLKAQKEFLVALKLNPLDFLSYLGLGNTYYQMQDFPRAIDSYQKALKINPYFYNAHFNLGILYQQWGRKKEAEEAFKATLELKPEDSATHFNLGRVYQDRGRIDLALREYQQALQTNPGHREILQAIEELKQGREKK